MKNKFTVLIAILLTLCLLGLAGCQSSQESSEKKKSSNIESPNKPTSISVLSFRFPATEHFTSKMKACEDGVDNLTVNVKLTSFDQLVEQTRLALSGSKSPYHIIYTYNEFYPMYIEKGWLQPLDEYIEKYKETYNLDDIPAELWESVSYDGHIYGIPFEQNIQHIFYRKDVFEKYNLQPPKTYDELIQICETLSKKQDIEYPFALVLNKPDGIFSEFFNALVANDGQLFDEQNHPSFNGPEGVKAVETLKKLIKYMPPGVLSYTNDDVMVGLQQGQIAMTNMWTTRASAMDDSKVSKVVGKIAYAPAPSSVENGVPHSNWAQDVWVIPKNCSDPELAFQVAAEATNYKNMKDAVNLTLVTRKSILDDSLIIEKNVSYPAAMATINAGAKPMQPKPYIGTVGDVISIYVGEALTGKMSTQDALNKAAAELEKNLKNQGYIK